jgi:TfoX/Sxy family transcriptional regulator of competence genes
MEKNLNNQKEENLNDNLNINEVNEQIKNIESNTEDKTINNESVISNKFPSNETNNQFISQLKERDAYINFILEKIRGLEQKQLVYNNQITSFTLRLEKIEKELHEQIIESDKIIKNNLTFPGLIGKFSKFKTMGEFFSNINDQMNGLIYFKNKKNLEYNIQIREMNNNIKQINFQIDQISKNNINFVNKTINENTKIYNEKIDNLNQVLDNLKEEFIKYKISNEEEIKKNIILHQKKIFEKISENEFYIDNKNEERKDLEENNEIKTLTKALSKILNNLLEKNWNEINDELKEFKVDINNLKIWKDKEQNKKNKKNRLSISQEKKSYIISKDKENPNISNSPKLINDKKSLSMSKSYSRIQNQNLLKKNVISKKNLSNIPRKTFFKKEEINLLKTKSLSSSNDINNEDINDNNILIAPFPKNNKNSPPSSNLFEQIIEPILYNNSNNYNAHKDIYFQTEISEKLKLKNKKKDISLLNPKNTNQFKDNNISLWINDNYKNESIRNRSMNHQEMNYVSDCIKSEKRKEKDKLNLIMNKVTYSPKLEVRKINIPFNPNS